MQTKVDFVLSVNFWNCREMQDLSYSVRSVRMIQCIHSIMIEKGPIAPEYNIHGDL